MFSTLLHWVQDKPNTVQFTSSLYLKYFCFQNYVWKIKHSHHSTLMQILGVAQRITESQNEYLLAFQLLAMSVSARVNVLFFFTMIDPLNCLSQISYEEKHYQVSFFFQMLMVSITTRQRIQLSSQILSNISKHTTAY